MFNNHKKRPIAFIDLTELQPPRKRRKYQDDITNCSNTTRSNHAATEKISQCLINMGHKEFRKKQEDIIQSVVDGNNTFITMPTGSGKSLCYQSSILVRNDIIKQEGIHRPPIGVVVSPLLSLMEDQVLKLKECNIDAEYCKADDNKHQTMIKNKIKNGQLSILYMSPETFLSRSKKNQMMRLIMDYRKISAFCVDEVHCILMWGTMFRPSYFGLSSITDKYPNVPIIGCTATVSVNDTTHIQNNLRSDGRWNTFRDCIDRPNIAMNFCRVFDQDTVFRKALKIIKEIHQKYSLYNSSIIIYSGSRGTANKYCKYLNSLRLRYLNVGLYHSQISAKQKKETLESFLSNDINVVVSTSAFGMGIDKPNVRAVIHLVMPESIESYYQQIGRAGRDGKQAHAHMFTYGKDKFAESCFRDICSQSVRRITKMIFKEYDVDSNKTIGTSGKIWDHLVDKYGEKKVTNYGTSMKILQRFGILHRGGNWIYLLSKDSDRIDDEEIEETSRKSRKCVRAMKSFVKSSGCFRRRLLQYFGEPIVKKFPVECCSNCNN